jgi:hypothetical protein
MKTFFSKINQTSLILCGILLLSLVFQISTITWGLPDNTGLNAFAVDEIAIGNVILKMVSHHDLNPNWFVESSAQIYFAFIPAWVIDSLFYKISLVDIVIIERIVSIIFSLLTIVTIFYIGKEIKNELLGLISALFLALNPCYFFFGTYGKQDAVVTFFVTLSLFLLILYLKYENNFYAYLASFSAGLATSSKYIGGLMLLLIIGIIISNSILQKRIIQTPKIIIYAISLFILGFILLTPYSVITPDSFIKGSIGEYNHYQTSHPGIGQMPIYEFIPVFLGYYWIKSNPGMLLLSIFFLFGVVLTFKSLTFQHKRVVSRYVLLSWIIFVIFTFSLFIKIKSSNQMMMVIPAMMIFAACPIYILLKSEETYPKKKILAIFLILLTIPSIVLVIDHRLNDNRYKAADWITEHVSNEQSLAITAYVYVPYGYNKTQSLTPQNLSWFKTAKYNYFIASSQGYDRYLRFKDENPEYNKVFVTISDTPVGGIVGNYTVVKRFAMYPRLSEISLFDQIKMVFSNYDGEVEIIIMQNINS